MNVAIPDSTSELSAAFEALSASPASGRLRAMSQSPSAVTELLRRIPLLSDLTETDLHRLARTANHVRAAPGELVMTQGDAADGLYLVLDGEVEVLSVQGGEEVLLSVEGPGSFVGEMALLEESPRSASVRAVVDSEFLVIGPDEFQGLLEKSPGTSMSMLRTVMARLRSVEETLVEREKLAALGTLTAGLAHELNNPAAALPRTAQHLSELIGEWGVRSAEVECLELEGQAEERIRELGARMSQSAESQIDRLQLADAERGLEEWLEQRGFEDPWDLAPPLATAGWTVEGLEELAERLGRPALQPVINWLAVGLMVHGMGAELRRSARAISEVVSAIRMYAHQRRAAGSGRVDVAESIMNALTLLRHRTKDGVDLRTEISSDLPPVLGNAADLSQVWTILIENAVDAMDGTGTLEVEAVSEGEEVIVKVTDAGPGMPSDVRRQIFDPFFTTKPPGKGTGLGLAIAHRIITTDHRGSIGCQSQPGRTVFTVTLPRADP